MTAEPTTGWIAAMEDPESTVAIYDGEVWQILGLQGGQGVTDHGLLTGLGDDDHLQYLTNARGDVRYARIVHNHDAAYLSPAEVLAGANIVLDKTTTPGSVIISSDFLEEVEISDVEPLDPNVELWVDTLTGAPEEIELKEDKHYIHVQSILALTWSVGHGLGKHPAVTVCDAAGSEVQAAVRHISENLLEVSFTNTATGTVYCN